MVLATLIAFALLGYSWNAKTALALGSSSASQSTASTGPLSMGDASAARSVQVILREGTQVGATRGRFVLRGQRWRFMVKEKRSLDTSNVTQMVDGGIARKVLPRSNTILRRDAPNTQRPTQGSTHGFGSGAPDSKVPTQQNPQAIFDSMLVVENLMLERIANAIEEDPSDDLWMITGRVTEFQNENRLMLMTAFRASSAVTQ